MPPSVLGINKTQSFTFRASLLWHSKVYSHDATHSIHSLRPSRSFRCMCMITTCAVGLISNRDTKGPDSFVQGNPQAYRILLHHSIERLVLVVLRCMLHSSCAGWRVMLGGCTAGWFVPQEPSAQEVAAIAGMNVGHIRTVPKVSHTLLSIESCPD